MDMGEHANICSAHLRAAFKDSPTATVSVTKPSCWPSCAVTRRPVRMMPIACFIGIWLGNLNSPPAVAARPTKGSGSAKKRSEEHTSELQSLMRISYAVFCLKKKNRKKHSRYK